MNETKTGKMGYSGLIISHNGCLKINDKLENKFNTSSVSLDKEGYAGSLVYTYTDEDVFEIGEINTKNCKNDYPYAMAFKRCFDRVVLKKSKLAYAGVYSDSEADEFSGKDIELDSPEDKKLKAEIEKSNNSLIDTIKMSILSKMVDEYKIPNDTAIAILKKHGYNSSKDIINADYKKIYDEIEKFNNYIPEDFNPGNGREYKGGDR